MTPRKARIKDIAQLAGVSIGTVDRVLHNRGEVADLTKDKVLKIAKDLKYTPNFIAQALKAKKRLKIISLLPEPTEDNAFWHKHPEGIKRAITALSPFPVIPEQLTFDMLCEEDFRNKTLEVLKRKPDGVILAPIFKDETIVFSDQLRKIGIPLVFIDGFVKEAHFLSYTGEDVFQSGRVAGQLTDMVTEVDKDILIINIARNLQNVHHLNNRTMGFMSYFPESGRNQGMKISLNISDPGKESIKNELDKVLKKNPDIASMFITGSKSFKIADYLSSEGIRNINIIGYDLLDKNVDYLNKGMIRFLIGQRPEEQTYLSVRKLFNYLSMNMIPDKFEYLPVDIVTSENVKFFVNNQ